MTDQSRARRAIPEGLLEDLGINQADLDSTMVRRAFLRADDDEVDFEVSYRPARAARALPAQLEDEPQSPHRLAESTSSTKRARYASAARSAEPTADEVDQPTAKARRAVRALKETEPAGDAAEQSTEQQASQISDTQAIKVAKVLRELQSTQEQLAKPSPDGTGILAAVGTKPKRYNTNQLLVVGSLVVGLIAMLLVQLSPAWIARYSDTVALVTATAKYCPGVPNGQLDTLAVHSNVVKTPLGQANMISPAAEQDSVAGGTFISADGKSAWSSCVTPAADQYLQLPGGTGAKVHVVNTENHQVLIDITLSGPTGDLTQPEMRGIALTPGEEYNLDPAKYDQSNALGVRVRASSGRVATWAEVVKEDGTDFANPTSLAKQVLINGIPADAQFVELIFTNPGTTRNKVQIDHLSTAGRVPLTGFESYSLNAQRSVALTITPGLANLASSLLISAEEPFAVSAVAVSNGELTIIPGLTSQKNAINSDAFAPVPGHGKLLVVNPTGQQARFSVDWGQGQAVTDRQLAPGTLVELDIPDKAKQVRLQSDLFVAGSLVLPTGGLTTIQLSPIATSIASVPMAALPKLGD